MSVTGGKHPSGGSAVEPTVGPATPSGVSRPVRADLIANVIDDSYRKRCGRSIADQEWLNEVAAMVRETLDRAAAAERQSGDDAEAAEAVMLQLREERDEARAEVVRLGRQVEQLELGLKDAFEASTRRMGWVKRLVGAVLGSWDEGVGEQQQVDIAVTSLVLPDVPSGGGIEPAPVCKCPAVECDCVHQMGGGTDAD